MKQDLALIAAPTMMQPGGYIPKAYVDRVVPSTPAATLETEKNVRGWRIHLTWDCPEPVKHIRNETDRFADAAALSVPAADNAPWMTMGAPGLGVEAVLWRADREAPFRIQAEGLGTVQRSEAPEGWSVQSEWKEGQWRVVFQLSRWAHLDARSQLAVAIWRGASSDRGGLKSTSLGWIEVKP